MQITSRFGFSLVACALLGGCAGVSSTRIVGDTVGAAGGALLGKSLGKGSSVTTALGAGGRLLLSETLHAGSPSAGHFDKLKALSESKGSGPHGPTDRFPSVWVWPSGRERIEGRLSREEIRH